VNEDGYFGERIAAGYDASTGEMGEPGAVDPAVSLLAELAGGMRLRERWAGWTREPFTSDSEQHVSIWEKPAR
jgi:hypothetical protein